MPLCGRKATPAASSAAELVPLREPDTKGLLEIQAEKERLADELRDAVWPENAELQDETQSMQRDAAELEERLHEIATERRQYEEAEEAAERHREERVKSLRRKSLSKTAKVDDLRRKSAVQDVHIAELRKKVEEASASQHELQECEAGARAARAHELRAHYEWTSSKTEESETLASLDQEREKCIHSEKEVEQLGELIEETQAEAIRKEANYWQDATFLRASEDVVAGYESQMRENTEACAEIEEQIRKHHSLEEAAVQEDMALHASSDEKIPATLLLSLSQTEEDTQEAFKVASRSHSRSPVRSVRTSPQCSPRMLLERTPLSAPSRSSAVQAALATLHSENDRLRQKVEDMRKEIESRPSSVQEDGQWADGSFDAAVAGTGARVVHQMKQALHERLGELRNLHRKKQELDKERRKERRMRADLERRLASLSAPCVDAYRSDGPSSRKDSIAPTVLHSL